MDYLGVAHSCTCKMCVLKHILADVVVLLTFKDVIVYARSLLLALAMPPAGCTALVSATIKPPYLANMLVFVCILDAHKLFHVLTVSVVSVAGCQVLVRGEGCCPSRA